MSSERFEDFKVINRIRKANLFVQIVLGVILFFGLNFVASRHYMKWDLSGNMKNSLSPESAAYVKSLSAPVEIYAVVARAANDKDSRSIMQDLRSVFSQYEYLSTKNAPITATIVNAHIENKKTEELASRFGGGIEDSVIIAGPKSYKKIPITDFYEIDEGVRKGFNGESLITSAILSVSTGKDIKIYFVKGHGEMSFKSANMSRGMSEFASALTGRNYRLEELDLSEAKKIPDDASLVIIAGARAAFLPREIDVLRNYLLKSAGRLMVFLDMGPLNGLEDVMADWGVMSDDLLVLDSGGDYESASGDLIARGFPEKPHQIARYLIEANMPVQFGSARPVRQDMGAPIDDTLKLDALILSGPQSWGERSYIRGGEQRYDDDADLAGPLPLAMVATRTAGDDLGLRIPGGKLIVFGDENFIANKWFNRLGNSKLALNSVNWMIDDNTTLNIAPRKVDLYVLTLARDEILGLGLRFMILPAVVLLLCLVVFLRRRN